MGGGAVAVLYPHSVLHFSPVNGCRPKYGNPIFSLKETANYRHYVSSIRADGNPRDRPSPNRKGADDKSSVSSSKEQILALFKRIQSSISKADSTTINLNQISSKTDEEKKPPAESLLQVLHQSTTHRKGKSLGKKEDMLMDPRKDSPNKEDWSTFELKSTRPPSSFKRSSPITHLSSPRDKSQVTTQSQKSSPRDKSQVTTQSQKFKDMKLTQLKEIAKSKGIKGYSKLKKTALIELLLSK